MGAKKGSRYRSCTGVLPLGSGKVRYDCERDAIIVAGLLEGSETRGVPVNLRLVEEGITLLIERLHPGASKREPCTGYLWVDTLSSGDRALVLAGPPGDGGARVAVVIGTMRESE